MKYLLAEPSNRNKRDGDVQGYANFDYNHGSQPPHKINMRKIFNYSLGEHLLLPKCPCCGVDTPSLHSCHSVTTKNSRGGNLRDWKFYVCSRCGGVVTAASKNNSGKVVCEIYPTPATIANSIPDRAGEFLKQAIDSLHSPAGSVMLCASSVDAMLKARSYTEGSLYSRIDKAAADHLITSEMAKWAHDVRLEANSQRHADQGYQLPSQKDAERCLEFVKALALILFELPALVAAGLNTSSADTPGGG